MSGDAQLAMFGGADLGAPDAGFLANPAGPRVEIGAVVNPSDAGEPIGLRGGLSEIGDNLYYGATSPEYFGKTAARVADAYCAALRQLGLDMRSIDADILHEMCRSGRYRKARDGISAKAALSMASVASMRGASVIYGGARTWFMRGGVGEFDPVRHEGVKNGLWGLAQCLAQEGFAVGVIRAPRYLMAYRLLSGGAIAIIDNGAWRSRIRRMNLDKVDSAIGVRLR